MGEGCVGYPFAGVDGLDGRRILELLMRRLGLEIVELLYLNPSDITNPTDVGAEGWPSYIGFETKGEVGELRARDKVVD